MIGLIKGINLVAKKLGISTEVDESDPNKGQIKFPERLYIPPKSFTDREGHTT